MVVFGGMMLFFIDVGGCGLAGSLESRKSDIGGMGMVVGNVNGLVGSPIPFRMPTQYHLGLFCGMPWSLVLRIVW